MSDVFVSYARANEADALRIAQALQTAGYNVWRDDQLPVHRAYGEVIEERLAKAKAVVVLWSEQAARSQWVRSEANRAREAKKLVQLSIDGAGLPMPFDQIQCADLRGWTGEPDSWAWGRVVASVSDLLNPGAEPTPDVAPVSSPLRRLPRTPSLPIRPTARSLRRWRQPYGFEMASTAGRTLWLRLRVHFTLILLSSR